MVRLHVKVQLYSITESRSSGAQATAYGSGFFGSASAGFRLWAELCTRTANADTILVKDQEKNNAHYNKCQ